jgi:hypothetical protein
VTTRTGLVLRIFRELFAFKPSRASRPSPICPWLATGRCLARSQASGPASPTGDPRPQRAERLRPTGLTRQNSGRRRSAYLPACHP